MFKVDKEVIVELQSHILGLKLAELKDFGINMKWVTKDNTRQREIRTD